MIELKVVAVTTNPTAYPEHAASSEEYAYLVPYVVEDEVETFVVDSRVGAFWGVDEFFACNIVTHFFVDPEELD